MKLFLVNGEKIPITRHTCGFGYFSDQYVETPNQIGMNSNFHCDLNINPVKCLDDFHKGILKGFFVIGAVWHENYEKIIPISSVVYIENDDIEWG